MKNLDRGLAISITGPVRDEVLAAFHRHIDVWDVALPKVEPLVLDFGLDEFEKFGLIEYWISNELEAGYCGKYLFLFEGQTCPKHHHRVKHESFFLLEGCLEVDYNDQTYVLNRGDTLPIFPGKYHSFKGLKPSLLLELSMPCVIDDNYFEDTRIPIGGNYKSTD